MANETDRNYSGSDAYMVQTGLTLRTLFLADLADFTAFDADFDAGYAADWLTALNAADGVVRDAQVQDIIEAETADVIEKMDQCRKKYGEVKYFASKAFPANKPVRDEFGTEDYKKARNRQGKLIELMGILHRAAEKYKVQLIAQQYSQPRIDEIKTLRDELQQENTEQDAAIKGRPVLSNERVNMLNQAYDITAHVCEAAQVIYEDNQTKRDQYVYSPGSGETILGTVQNTVAAGMTGNTGPLPAGTQKIRMTVLTNGPLEFGLTVDGLNFDGNTTTMSAPASTTYTIADFASAGTSMAVKNQNLTLQGEYKVEFLG